MTFSLLMCLIACEDEENKGLMAGFYGEIPAAPYMCAYRSDKTVFDINDVTLSFSYAYIGTYFNFESDEAFICFLFNETSLNGGEWINTAQEGKSPHWVFIMNMDNWHLIRKINLADFYVKENASLMTNSEEITIPKELFICQQGCITFSITELYVWDDGRLPEYRGSGSVHIYYKKLGDKVVLSASSF